MSASRRTAKHAGSVTLSTLALRSAATQLRSIASYLEDLIPQDDGYVLRAKTFREGFDDRARKQKNKEQVKHGE